MGTGLLTFNYLTSVGRHQSSVVAPRRVVVAARDIVAHVIIKPDMVATVMRPGDAIEPDSIRDPADVVGRLAAVSVPAGGTISSSRITTIASRTLVMRVPRGLRALAIPLDRVKGVGNLVQPGDHVDVIAVTPARANTAPRAATILRDVPVLAMGMALETPQGATPSPESGYQTASLAVTPDQAKLLTLVDLNATLRLALRAPSDGYRRPTVGDKLDLTLPAGPRVAQAPPAAPAAAAPAAPPAAPAAPPRAPAVAAVPRYTGPQIIQGDKVIK